MVFVKIVKNKAYFSRFQTKFRRRREGKTDFRARRRMVCQDKNKYNSPKYRLIVRLTNKDVICQVAYSKVQGDMIVADAYAHELPAYGATVGLTNYAACYATGLLCARRLLKKYKLDTKYEGCTEVNGEYYEVEEGEGARPFKAILDLGLARATTGARIFGALKGAADGGVNVPHGDKRFPGFSKGNLDAEKHRQRIFGVHVAAYQKELLKDNQDKYNQLFSRYKAAKIQPDGIEGMWKKCHAAIRKNPDRKPAKKAPAKHKKVIKQHKRTTDERLHAAKQKKTAIQNRLAREANQG
mmetsp:Transcript_126048/g.177842  ORF Transcript_126048/g.177842 Transcript_126048/m.177842 type:complete len:297 (+) Transcript_126048:35-925(+)